MAEAGSPPRDRGDGPPAVAARDVVRRRAGEALTTDGQILLVHSALSATQATFDALAEAGYPPPCSAAS